MIVTARPFRHLCPEADLRDAMDETEFWAHVFGGNEAVEGDWDDDDVPSFQSTPCRVCGTVGACGYDDEGRVLIHATEPDDE